MLYYIDWDVSEVIIQGTPLRWYSLMFLAGFSIGFFMMKRFFTFEKAPIEWLDSLLMYMVLGTILGARLGHCLFYDWDYFSQHPLEILLPVKFEPTFRFTGFQGLASHGGALGIILSLWIWSRKISKRPLLWILDRMVVPTALTGAFIRFGNLMNSEIVGKETDAPWGFIFRRLGEDFPRHPVQLYESISYLLIFFLLFFVYWKTDAKNKLGRIFGMFFV
ncbi:MAG: prolipoprotein diacylglyceryl transferase, partial [Bacteroidota bacterium]